MPQCTVVSIVSSTATGTAFGTAGYVEAVDLLQGDRAREAVAPNARRAFVDRGHAARTAFGTFRSVSEVICTAVASARGEYLVFIGDSVAFHKSTYARLLRVAQQSGADVVIGRHQSVGGSSTGARPHPLATVRPDCEAPLHDWAIFNKVIRTSFWREVVGDLPDVSSPFVTALARIYASQPKIAVAKLPRRARPGLVAAPGRGQVIDGLKYRSRTSLDRFIIERAGMNLVRWALAGNAERRAAISAILRSVWQNAPEKARADSYVRGRLLTFLASEERWDDADRIDGYFAETYARPPAYHNEGRVYYDLGGVGSGSEAPALAEDLRALSRREAGHITEVHEATWTNSLLTLTGWSYLRGLNVEGNTYRTRVFLRDQDGERRELPTTPVEIPWADRWTREPHASYAKSAFSTKIDLAALDPSRSPHTIGVSLDLDGELYESDKVGFSRSGSARLLRHHEVGQRAYSVELLPDGTLNLTVVASAPSPNGDDADGSAPRSSATRAAPQVAVTEMDLTSEALTITVTGDAERPDETDRQSWRLRGASYSLSPTAIESHVGSTKLTFKLDTTDFHGRSIPASPSELSLTREHQGSQMQVPASRSLAGQLPIRLRNAQHAVQPDLSDELELSITIEAPLQLEEAGVRAQQLLRDEYRTMQVEPLDAVLFQCYQGEFAADSQLAIHHEILRRRPDAVLYWSVSSYSTSLPDSAIPVLIGSREWYRILASVTYICHNTHFPVFFDKRPHQRLLQTFHGYPVKTMGRAYMQQTGDYTPGQIQQNLDRHNREWDAITVPSELVADICRTEYEFAGDLLMTGYPRNDALLADTATQVREQTREALGVPPDKTAVLYAPTWRETLKLSSGHSEIYRGLDLAALAANLGEQYVILARGHDYNLRAGDTFDGTAGVIDVTAYPDVNDLIVAADIALLDYSSLRFDWALTGKPMVFYIPDYDEYLQMRGFLIPFEQTAPGPVVRDFDDLAAVLRNPAGVVGKYAGQLAAFNAEYNPHADGHAAERAVDLFFSDFVRRA